MLDSSGLAVIRDDTPHFDVLRRGSHVLCAVTGERVPLSGLLYWNAECQEAYRGPVEATVAALAGGARKLRR